MKTGVVQPKIIYFKDPIYKEYKTKDNGIVEETRAQKNR